MTLIGRQIARDQNIHFMQQIVNCIVDRLIMPQAVLFKHNAGEVRQFPLGFRIAKPIAHPEHVIGYELAFHALPPCVMRSIAQEGV